MSVVETGQISAAATEQMFSVETRQMSTCKTGRCPVPPFYIYLASVADICPVSAADIRPVSAADVCHVSTADRPSVARANICFASTHNIDAPEVSIVAMSQCSSRR